MPDAIQSAFSAALAADAGAAVEDIPAPPRRAASVDPVAPHGRDDAGEPLAPFGLKADGTPRIKPAGPGRGGKQDAPRVAELAAHALGAEAGRQAAETPPDYSGDLDALATSVWLGLSVLKGGRLWRLPIPDTRPYAAVWRMQQDAGVAAWNVAAHQNPTVRAYVRKLSGEGSLSWTVGVGLWSAGLVASCVEMRKAPEDIRAAAVEANDAELAGYVEGQLAALGVRAPEAVEGAAQ